MRPVPSAARPFAREAGASTFGALMVLVLSLGVGFVGGYALHQAGASSPSTLTLAPPGTTTVPDTTIVPESTLGLGTEVPVTTEAPVETTVPVVTEAPAAPIALGTSGALFDPVTDRRLFDSTVGCDSFTQSQTTGSSRNCDRFTVGNIDVAWSIDSETDVVDVLWHDPAANEDDVWNIALRVDAANVTRDPRIGDVTGDGKQDIVVGANTDNGLGMDVIEMEGSQPTVTLHLDLRGGRVRLGAGELHVWRAVEGSSDMLEHLVLNRANGPWQVSSRELVKARNVGPSQV